MVNSNKMEISKDLPNRKLIIQRRFDADPELVWKAWTTAEILDQWWAPQPYRAETRLLDFREGGKWVYAMVGPDQSRMWCKVNFTRIEAPRFFEAIDNFCDENETVNTDLPSMHWKTEFIGEEQHTLVLVTLQFDQEADLNKIIEMGFEAGFAAGLNNLENYLQSQQLKG